MNDPEVNMSDSLTNTGFIAHRKALEAAGTAIALVVKIPAPLKPIADHVIRSARSVPANLAEGHGRSGRDRLERCHSSQSFEVHLSVREIGMRPRQRDDSLNFVMGGTGIAYASAKETDSHLRLLARTGAVNPSAAQTALDGFDEVRAMTWRLLNPKR